MAFTHPQLSRRFDWKWLLPWRRAALSCTIVGVPFMVATVRAFLGTGRTSGDLAVTKLAVRAVGMHAVLE